MTKCQGNLLNICTKLYKLFPIIHRPIQYQLVAKDEMKFFKQHGINIIWPQPNLVVPKLKNLPEFYRTTFDQNDNGFNKEVQQTIKKPDLEELFGKSSGEEEAEEAQTQPPKKKPKVG